MIELTSVPYFNHLAVLRQVKEYNDGEFSCNGGAFFWVAEQDIDGSWSDLVWEEVRLTSGKDTHLLQPPYQIFVLIVLIVFFRMLIHC